MNGLKANSDMLYKMNQIAALDLLELIRSRRIRRFHTQSVLYRAIELCKWPETARLPWATRRRPLYKSQQYDSILSWLKKNSLVVTRFDGYRKSYTVDLDRVDKIMAKPQEIDFS